ncbi:hypothetical protein OG454_36465 [Streptomyces sp. NBC_00105]|nr:hypothetical protein [Streptomyces spororaveus]MCM9077959.1 hypothetical protein [Streptomyces spororaveus]
MLSSAVACELRRVQAQLLGDVVDHDAGHLFGVVQERSQVPDGPELDRPADPVPRALGGHRPAPRGLVE